ncbi:MAG: hypothetical protein WBM64_11195 [Woeseiaceae bacterium]
MKRWLRNTTAMAAIVGAWTIPITTTSAATDISVTTRRWCTCHQHDDDRRDDRQRKGNHEVQ